MSIQKETFLGGLYEFPGVEVEKIGHLGRGFQKAYNLVIMPGKHYMNTKHIFTHLIWEMQVYRCKCLTDHKLKAGLQWIPIRELDSIPIPVAFQKIKEKIISEWS